MMVRFAAMMLLCTALLLPLCAHAFPAADRITGIPGYGELRSRHFSGYVPVSNGTRETFYWFVESEGDPKTDPLVLWLNGGPGCSSLLGNLAEIGPNLARHGGSFQPNSWSWTRLANVLFLESPPGVGFSIDKTPETVWNDQIVAELNYESLRNWLYNKFPSLVGRPFYITGESYAGHYVPQLANQILHGPDKAVRNMMQGFAVGNPCTGTAANNDLDWCFTDVDPTYDEYLQSHALMSFDPQIKTDEGVYDPYDILERTCRTQLVEKVVRWRKPKPAAMKPRYPEIPVANAACADIYLTDFLNRVDVKAAIHANPTSKWSECANINYATPNTTAGVLPIYRDIMENTNWKVLVYSGDADTVVNFIQTEKIMISLGRRALTKYSPWYYPDYYNESYVQLGGYYVHYDRISWASAKGVGHMVPQYNPAMAYALLHSFLQTGVPGMHPVAVVPLPGSGPAAPAPRGDSKANREKKEMLLVGLLVGVLAGALFTYLFTVIFRKQSARRTAGGGAEDGGYVQRVE